MAACFEIGVRTCFEHHVYQFGGRYYLQKSGGPIGMRVTMAAARIVMSDWGRKMKEILMKANMKTYLKALYVDDKRTVMPALAKGTRWVQKTKSFENREDWRREDEENAEEKGEHPEVEFINEMEDKLEKLEEAVRKIKE